MSKANNTQVAGDHYKTTYQHWDFVQDADFPYMVGQLTKYIVRWKKKNGLEDLKKASHYCRKQIEILEDKRHKALSEVERFITFNGLEYKEAEILRLLSVEKYIDLENTLWKVNALINQLMIDASTEKRSPEEG